MSVHINFIQRRSFRDRVWKTLNVVVVISTILSFSMVGMLIEPGVAAAQINEPEVPIETSITTLDTTPKPPTSESNPALNQTCGLDIGLVIDTSESVDSVEMGQMKTALKSFANGFIGTPTVFSLSSFSEESKLNQAFSRTPEQMAGDGPSTGDLSTDIPAVGSSFTNWDSGLARGFETFDPRPAKTNLLVIATDGSPNHWGYETSTGTFDLDLALSQAVTRANEIKKLGTRIVVIGIGEDTTDPATLEQKLAKMQAISGPNVAMTPTEISSLTDVIKVTDFSGISQAVAAYAQALCGGKILVQKQIDLNDDGQVDLDGSEEDQALSGWTFVVKGAASNPSPQQTSFSGALEFSNVLNGSDYIVTETVNENTKLVSASCTNGTQPVGTFDQSTSSITGLTMGTDDTISCTFINSMTQGKIKVTKRVINDNGGTNKIEDFPLFVGAQSVISGVNNSFLAGTYIVSETSHPNYTSTFTGDCALDGSMTLKPGDEKTCTITNDDKAPSLTVIKHVINDNGGKKVAADFLINVIGSAITTSFPGQENPGTNLEVKSGSYVVTEGLADGYTISYSGDCEQVIAFGEHKTCTITNNDIGPTIQLDKSTTQTSMTAGGHATYTVAWSILGEFPVTSAVITDALPSNTTFVSATCGSTTGTCGITATATTITWNLGNRSGATSGTVTVILKTPSPIANGTVITNTACFDTDQNTNVCDSATTIIQSAPNISIVKTNNIIGFTNPGKQVTYIVTVNNASSATDTAHAVVLTDILPAGFSYTIGGGSTKNFVLGDIAPGVSVTTNYTATISTVQAAGIFTNVAAAQGSNTTKVSATSNVEIRLPNVLGVTSEPNLLLTKTVNSQTVAPGQHLTYTVTISNTGDIDLTNVRLTDKLPNDFRFADSGLTSKTYMIGTLKAHRQRIINYLVNVGVNVKAGSYLNTASVLSNELDPLIAQAKVVVKVPQVLGLTATGPSKRDYVLFVFGLTLMIVGGYWLNQNRRQLHGDHLA